MSIEKKFQLEGISDYEVRGDDMDVWAQEVSDGYHTMKELYKHRFHLFIALCNVIDRYRNPLENSMKCWKSKLHEDGTMYENMFVAGITMLQFDGTVKFATYHLDLKYWDKMHILELRNAPKYDGHTSNDVLERLLEL